MSIFKSNRDLDSTLIIIGIHLIIAGVLVMEYLGGERADFTSTLNNLLIVYGMICSYFFKSQSQQQQNGNVKNEADNKEQTK